MKAKTIVEKVEMTPIGVARTNMLTKFDAPSQPTQSETERRNIIELYPGNSFEQCLKDLLGFDRIWLIWWFHKNSSWRSLVLPPRGKGIRRGLFATRSPHRPNPIGLTSTRLYEIKKRTLVVGELDLIDGTPILDIKPYISKIDAYNDCSMGWLSEVEAAETAPPKFSVMISSLAQEQIDWLSSTWGETFVERAIEILERDPSPHKTRRISRNKKGLRYIACGPWRVFFSVNDTTVTLDLITPGFPKRLLYSPPIDKIPSRLAQVALLERWPTDC